MSSRLTTVYRTFFWSVLALTSHSVLAAEPTQSLAEKRLSIFKGTAPGIVIVDFDKKPRAPASAPNPRASGSATATGTTAATANESAHSGNAVSQQPSESRFLSALPPPSGRSLQSARRLDAPDQGIALPTARSASAPQAEPAKR
jgi:hypothetical protein